MLLWKEVKECDWAGSLSGQRSIGPHSSACEGNHRTKGNVLGRQPSHYLTVILGQVMP